MSEQTQSTAPKSAGGIRANWPLLRKFETLVFACLLVLIPFFALKVFDICVTQLAVKQAASELVNDLNKAKTLARDGGLNVTVSCHPGSSLGPAAYLIQDDQRTLEEVALKQGVTVEGTAKFDSTGKPAAATSFTITKGLKKLKVLVDETGAVTAP